MYFGFLIEKGKVLMKRFIFKKIAAASLSVITFFSVVCSTGFASKAADIEDNEECMALYDSTYIDQYDLEQQKIANEEVLCNSNNLESTTLSKGSKFFKDGIKYEAMYDGTLAVCYVLKTIKEVNIPETVKYKDTDYKVTQFNNDENGGGVNLVMYRLTIPNSVVSIGDMAIRNCPNLKYLNIGNSVTQVGDDVLYQTYNIEKVVMGRTVGYLFATQKPVKVKEAVLLDSVDKIAAGAFYNCTELTTVNIPDGTTKISISAFKNCKSLQMIYIPSSVENIADNAFENSGIVAIHGEKGSYAEKYAKAHGYNFYSKT